MESNEKILLKKIQQLEESHAQLKQQMSNLIVKTPPGHNNIYAGGGGGGGGRIFGVGVAEWRRGSELSRDLLSLQRECRIRNVYGGAGGDGSIGVAARKKGSEALPKLSSPHVSGNVHGGGGELFQYLSPLLQSCGGDEFGRGGGRGRGWGGRGAAAAVNFTDKQYANILESMGQAVHIFDTNGILTYWSRTAEILYGYSAAEAVGTQVAKLLVESGNVEVANTIIVRVSVGESWTGLFPVRHKGGDRFAVIVTDTPLYDDPGNVTTIICMSCHSRHLQDIAPESQAAPVHFEVESCFRQPRSTVSAKLALAPCVIEIYHNYMTR